jgi:ABC-type transport system involved in multi-copper enzyme maturation permease subunit
MDVRQSLAFLRHLVQDTFRQAIASGIFWIMLAVTAICVVFCLSVEIKGDVSLHDDNETVYFLPQTSSSLDPPSVSNKQKEELALKTTPEQARREGIETVSGTVTLGFGAVSFPLSRERKDAVHFLELILAGGIAGAFGLLMALVWTAGFVPTFLDPSAASVLLAKPVSRRQLLLGKYLGVLAFVGFELVVFVVLTWLALSLRTKVWDMRYWWCIPLLLIQFAVFYSFSVLLAVLTRSTAACVFGSILFWLLGWGINYGSMMASATTEHRYLPASTVALTEASYWISPKPIDAGLILYNTMNAKEHLEKPEVFKLVEANPRFSPTLSIVTSLLLTCTILALSIHEFQAVDY